MYIALKWIDYNRKRKLYIAFELEIFSVEGFCILSLLYLLDEIQYLLRDIQTNV